jgi:hypothetical protein
MRIAREEKGAGSRTVTGLALSLAAAVALLAQGCGDSKKTEGATDGRPADAADAGGARPDAAPDQADGLTDQANAETSGETGGDTSGDAARDGGGDAGIAFALIVTESPPGPDNGNMTTWGGIRQYLVSGAGATLQPAAGIPAAMVADPAGLAFRSASSELFVGNRHGNNSTGGVAGSISRFKYDAANRTFTPNGTITGNGLSGVHDMTFSPTTGELFATNYVGCVSRFTFDGTGNATANGTLGTGSCRGVAVSADGKRLYVTLATTTIQQFALQTGGDLGTTAVAGNPSLHYLAWQAGRLYAAGLTNNTIHRFDVIASGALMLKDTIASSSPSAIAFSPDGLEMLSSGHKTSSLIERYPYQAGTDAWGTPTDFNADRSLGDILVVP